jgi:hypothetical protein
MIRTPLGVVDILARREKREGIAFGRGESDRSSAPFPPHEIILYRQFCGLTTVYRQVAGDFSEKAFIEENKGFPLPKQFDGVAHMNFATFLNSSIGTDMVIVVADESSQNTWILGEIPLR